MRGQKGRKKKLARANDRPIVLPYKSGGKKGGGKKREIYESEARDVAIKQGPEKNREKVPGPEGKRH